jgi:hypothetical protein
VRHVALAQEPEREEQLVRVRAHRADVQAHVLPEPLHDLAQVHAGARVSACAGKRRRGVPQRLEDEAEVPTVLERALEPDDVPLILGVSLHQLVEDLDLLMPRFDPWALCQPVIPTTNDTGTHIDSWQRVILIATSLPGSPSSTRARTTIANMPLPSTEKTW